MPKPTIHYRLLERYVLIVLYRAFAEDRPMAYSLDMLRNRLEVPRNVMKVIVDTLEERDHIFETTVERQRPDTSALASIQRRMITETINTGKYELTSSGRSHVEKISDEDYDAAIIAIDSKKGSDAFSSSPIAAGLPDQERWNPLPIDRMDPDLPKVRENLKSLIDIIEKDNGYKESEPNERSEVLSGLKGALDIIDNGVSIGHTALQVYILWPLDRIARRFDPSTIIGSAAAIFWSGFKDWAKSTVGVVLNTLVGLK